MIVFGRPKPNEDHDEHGLGMVVFIDTARPIDLVSRSVDVSQQLCNKAHLFLLSKSPGMEPYLEYVVPSLMS